MSLQEKEVEARSTLVFENKSEVEHKLPINQGMGIRTRSFESFSVEKCQVTNQCLE